jgi:hypothetical protein
MVKDWDVADAPVESVTLMVNVKVPWAVGVPEIRTELVELASSDKPPGKEPDATDHANGATPPDALTVAV